MVTSVFAFCLLFTVIILVTMTVKTLKFVNHYHRKMAELRRENFKLTYDKMRLADENEFLRLRLIKETGINEF